MPIVNFLELKDKFEIQRYVKPKNFDEKNYQPFTGSPRKHPYEKTRVIVIVDPFSDNAHFYEFNIDDIAFAEELSNISNLKGDSVSMIRVWVKKGSPALHCTPFMVGAK